MGDSAWVLLILLILATIVAVPIFFLVQIEGLRARLARLEARLSGLIPAAKAPIVAPEPGPKAYQTEPLPARQPDPVRAPVPVEAAFVAFESMVEPEQAHASKAILNWEMFAGGRLLNFIGAIVLVIGVGLFLKYAFDMNWITFAMRVVTGVVLGAGLLGFGEFCHRQGRARWFSQGIIGAGLGVLYVSGHAAFASYHLVPFAVAYAFMSLVTIVAFLLAVRYDAFSVALLGWLGGFVTPFVLNDGGLSEIGFASYLILLDIGLVAVGIVKARWFVFEPLALAASYVAAFAWYAQHADPSAWFVTTIALLSLWLVFFAASVARALSRDHKGELDILQLLGVVNAVLFWSYAALVLRGHDGALQAVLAIAAGAYAAGYALVLARAPLARMQRIIYYGTGVAFLFGWTWLHFPNAYAGTVAIALEALALVGIDLLVRKRLTIDSEETSIFAALLLTLQCVASAEASVNPLVQTGWHFDFAFGGRDLAVASAGVAFVAVQWLLGRRPLAAGTGWVLPVLRLEAALALAVFTAGHLEGFALADAYALEAVALAFIGTRAMLRDLELASLAFLGAAGICAANAPNAWYYERIFAFDPWHNGRLLATGVLAASALVAGEFFRRRSLLPGAVGRTLRIAGAAVAVAGVTLQVRDHFELAHALSALNTATAAAQAQTLGLGYLEQVAISGVWIAASLVLVGLGVGFRLRDLRLMAIGLFALTIGKAFFFDLGSLDGLYRIAAFIGLGLVLLAVSYIYVRLEQRALPSGQAGESRLEPAEMPA